MEMIVLLVVTVGMLFLAYYLAPKPKKQDEQIIKTALSRRGDFIPYLIGCHKIEEYFFGWAGDRRSDDGGGGKGFLFGSSGGDENTWYESGWHVLGTGPAHGLSKISQNGETIWEGDLTPISAPSGTTVTLDNGEGVFRIFWGEIDQPINTFLGDASRVGINSRWPYTFYVEWVSKKLGAAPVWPKLDYVACVECFGISLRESPFILEDDFSRGVNGADALLRMLALPFPHGAGIPTTALDNDTLEELGTRCEDEHLPVNMIARGETYEALVRNLLQDLGYWMPQIGQRLAFLPWRETTTPVPVLDDDVIEPPDAENTRSFGVTQPTRIVFTFKSEQEGKYEDQDIVHDDDAASDEEGSIDSQSVVINSFTHPNPASAAARRRVQENSLSAGQRLSMLRGARNLQPGQVFDRAGLGRMVVLSRTPKDDGPAVQMECVFDQYAFPDIPDAITPGEGSGGSLAVEPDIAFDWFEIPGTPGSIVVFRTRAHQQIAGSRIYVGLDGSSSFSLAGNQNVAASGGLLETAIDELDGPDIIVTGPTFEASNKDASTILDLSGDIGSWQDGRQLAVINNELFYLQSVTVQSEDDWEPATVYAPGDVVIPAGAPTGFRYRCTTGGTSAADEPAWPQTIGDDVDDNGVIWECVGLAWQMNNLIRARETSVVADHAIGARVYIIDRTKLIPLTHPIIAFGNTVCVKSVPFTATQIVPISSVVAVCKAIELGSGGGDLRITSEGDFRVTQTGDNRAVELT